VSVEAPDAVYLEHRGAMFGLAYRMLGTVADAEDVVAEAYLRWRRDDRSDVADPRAYLMSVVARLSLDLLKSAQRKRVDYVGPWLPEPLVTSYDADPALTVERTDTVSLAFLHVLERLTPQERAVFVLRSAFDYPHADIGQLLNLSPDNVRQLYRRAQQRLGDDAAPRFAADPATQRALVERFLAASASGEVEPLAALLADDITMIGDGGGKAASIRRPLLGRLRVARFLRGLSRRLTAQMSVVVVRANGAPALLVVDSGRADGIYALDIDANTGLVRAIHAVRNPDKLRHVVLPV
jgi:RNA polymerase sigma-70 factor (ECF subfamily)